MALLDDETRSGINKDLNSEVSAERMVMGIGYQDLRAVINAMDAWLDSKMGSLNSAIPQPARDVLTTKQKVRIFLRVINKRWEVE